MDISAGMSATVPSSVNGQGFLPGTWFVGYWQIADGGGGVNGSVRKSNGWNVANMSSCICNDISSIAAELTITVPSNATIGSYTATFVVCIMGTFPLLVCINSAAFNVVVASTNFTDAGPAGCGY